MGQCSANRFGRRDRVPKFVERHPDEKRRRQSLAKRQGLDPFLGQFALMPYNVSTSYIFGLSGTDYMCSPQVCPNGWLPAARQVLSITQNTALFSLLGTTYGNPPFILESPEAEAPSPMPQVRRNWNHNLCPA